MSVLTITSGLYSNSKKIINNLLEQLNSKVITDADIIEKTNQIYNVKLATLKKVVESKQIAFNDFTHEKEKCTALLKNTISEFVSQGSCIFHGNLGHLIPKEVSHVMRVLIISNKDQRIKNGIKNLGLSEKDVIKNMEISDKYAFLWTNFLFGKKAWNNSLYDIIIPTDKLDSEESVDLILKHLKELLSNKEEMIKSEVFDFKLATDVEIILSKIGQGLLVKVSDGRVVVTIDKKVLMLSKFQQKIIDTVQQVPNVKSVETEIGKNYYSYTDLYYSACRSSDQTILPSLCIGSFFFL